MYLLNFVFNETISVPEKDKDSARGLGGGQPPNNNPYVAIKTARREQRGDPCPAGRDQYLFMSSKNSCFPPIMVNCWMAR